jgi:aryl-alcohol dehydrogenase-like predicted oxidoreductase
MKYRALGSTGLTVSAIGFGGWGIGGVSAGATSYGETDDAVSRRALACAFERGITFFDTSPAYGDGRSERLIGEVFTGRRDKIVIATKAG